MITDNSLATRLNNWLKVTFSKRKLCYVFFVFEESGVDLKKPVTKMEPYLAWIHPQAKIDAVSELFSTKIKKGRNLKLLNIKIEPIQIIPVI